jgi:hypothetical protein
MAILEAVLAVVGLLALILCLIGWQGLRGVSDPPPVEPDLAAPYRAGLHAAIRMQAVAQDLEQQLYAEALKHVEDEPGGES